jgi:hypothetical protein
MNLRPFFNYLKQILLWTWRGKYHVLTILSVIAAILYVVGVLNFYPTVVSALLSITGLLIILSQQILDARQFADHRPNTLHNWIVSFPRRKPKSLSAKLNATVEMSGKMHATVSVAENAIIEEKVAFLLRQVTRLQAGIGQIHDRIDEVAASSKDKSKELKTELDHLDVALQTTIAGHIVGAYDINLFGIIITICGTLIQLFRS